QIALLSTAWKDPAGFEAARTLLTRPSADTNRRLKALEALVAANDGRLLDAVDALLARRDQNPVEFRGRVLAALGRTKTPRVGQVVLSHYGRLEPELQPRVIELLT